MIVLYGATGYTGRLVAAELAARGIDFAVAGRSRERLDRLAAAHGGVPVRVASVDDHESLVAMLDGASVLINCAGPFVRLGRPVVEAAVEAGVHYVDSTGEQPFIRWVYDTQDTAARARGVALVPALGFDYAPGDCIAQLTGAGLGPLQDVVIAYRVRDFGVSRGTVRSVIEILGSDTVEWRGGAWQRARRTPSRGAFTFPDPVGRTAMVRYPSGEQLMVPRHLDTSTVTTIMSCDSLAPTPLLTSAVPVLQSATSLALRTPLRHVALGWVDRFVPEEPAPETQQSSEFTIGAVALAEDGTVRRGIVHGGDPYGLTAVSLVGAAMRLGEPGYDLAGALTPAQAIGAEAYLDSLGRIGLTWELQDPEAARRSTSPRPHTPARV